MEIVSATPIVVDSHNDTYVNPNATIFMTVGTAGDKRHGFTGQAPYIAQQFIRHGYVDVNVIDNGTKIQGKFYDNVDGKVKDTFTIVQTMP